MNTLATNLKSKMTVCAGSSYTHWGLGWFDRIEHLPQLRVAAGAAYAAAGVAWEGQTGALQTCLFGIFLRVACLSAHTTQLTSVARFAKKTCNRSQDLQPQSAKPPKSWHWRAVHPCEIRRNHRLDCWLPISQAKGGLTDWVRSNLSSLVPSRHRQWNQWWQGQSSTNWDWETMEL